MGDLKELQLLRSNYYAENGKIKKSLILQFTIVSLLRALFVSDGMINILTMQAAPILNNTASDISSSISNSRIPRHSFHSINTGIICFSTVILKHIDFSAYTCFYLFVILSYSNFRTAQFTAKIQNAKLPPSLASDTQMQPHTNKGICI